MQAVYNYEDLKGKLAAAVTEARASILYGREQIGLAAGQIKNASESYRLSERQMEENLAKPTDVLMAVRSLEQAHFNHLQAISGHNKAQVRLLMLLGGGPPPPPHKPPPPHQPPAAPPGLVPAVPPATLPEPMRGGGKGEAGRRDAAGVLRVSWPWE
jgi:outer membrane protein TolC